MKFACTATKTASRRYVPRGFQPRLHSPRLLSVAALAGLMTFAATPASAFLINPTFDSSITSLTNAAAVESTINQVISLYDSTFNNAVTINITFQDMTSGLGQSSTAFTSQSTATYLAALAANSSGDAIDTAALVQLAANPYTGSTIGVSTANARALGLSGAASTDGIVGLNTGLCFTGHTSPVSGKVDLFAVAAHEIDEVLGTSSGVGGGFQDTDLFRYDGSGNRSFTTSSSAHAYFSVDGTTLIDEYNQFNHQPGDYGDWITHNPPQVQDYALPGGVLVNPGVGEFGLLDAIGYNITPAPEPASMALLGFGAVALLRRRAKR
ncbi:MAG: NF038122 family metalloprotease [Fimbriimonadaceae bacterium]